MASSVDMASAAVASSSLPFRSRLVERLVDFAEETHNAVVSAYTWREDSRCGLRCGPKLLAGGVYGSVPPATFEEASETLLTV